MRETKHTRGMMKLQIRGCSQQKHLLNLVTTTLDRVNKFLTKMEWFGVKRWSSDWVRIGGWNKPVWIPFIAIFDVHLHLHSSRYTMTALYNLASEFHTRNERLEISTKLMFLKTKLFCNNKTQLEDVNQDKLVSCHYKLW